MCFEFLWWIMILVSFYVPIDYSHIFGESVQIPHLFIKWKHLCRCCFWDSWDSLCRSGWPQRHVVCFLWVRYEYIWPKEILSWKTQAAEERAVAISLYQLEYETCLEQLPINLRWQAWGKRPTNTRDGKTADPCEASMGSISEPWAPLCLGCTHTPL